MSEDDPFDDLPEDREGDPFERLDDAPPDGETATDVPESRAGEGQSEGGDKTIEEEFLDAVESQPADDDPAFEEEFVDADDDPAFQEEFVDADDPFGDGMDPAGGSRASGGTDASNPPADDDLFSEMDGREGDPFGEGESVFESVDVASVDADEVWESLDDDGSADIGDGARYVEVSKHRFCEQCEHFASPPAARCTHEEAEIIEYLDMETVRLLDCPVVAEQRRLETEE